MGSQKNSHIRKLMKLLSIVFLGGVAINAAPAVPAAHDGNLSTAQQAILDKAVADEANLETKWGVAKDVPEADRSVWDHAYVALWNIYNSKYEDNIAAINSFSGYAKDFSKLVNVLDKINNAYDKAYDAWDAKYDQATAAAALAADVAAKVAAAAEKSAQLATDVNSKKPPLKPNIHNSLQIPPLNSQISLL